jgi:hypothetical protein
MDLFEANSDTNAVTAAFLPIIRMAVLVCWNLFIGKVEFSPD